MFTLWRLQFRERIHKGFKEMSIKCIFQIILVASTRKNKKTFDRKTGLDHNDRTNISNRIKLLTFFGHVEVTAWCTGDARKIHSTVCCPKIGSGLILTICLTCDDVLVDSHVGGRWRFYVVTTKLSSKMRTFLPRGCLNKKSDRKGYYPSNAQLMSNFYFRKFRNIVFLLGILWGLVGWVLWCGDGFRFL